MADKSNFDEILVECVTRAGTSSRKLRWYIFEELLFPTIERNEFSVVGVKALCNIVVTTLYRYNDAKSRYLVLEAIKRTITHHNQAAVNPLVKMLSSIKVIPSHSSFSMSASLLVPLKWSCFVVKYGFSNSSECQGPTWTKVVFVQCALLSAVLSNGHNTVQISARKWFHNTLKTIPGVIPKYFDAIQSTAQSPVLLCAVGELFYFLTKIKDFETLNKYKKTMVELYINVVLGGKTKQESIFLQASSRLLQHITHQEFKGNILPVIQKSLLRNPEVVIEAISHLFKDLSIDLSQHASLLSKSLSAHLHSKDDKVRETAITCIQNLSKQCSDAAAVKDIIEHLFAVLNGSEGKLTVWTDRVGVLKGLENTEDNAIGGSSALEELSALVVQKMEPFLQQEVNETVILAALSVLKKWCSHFSENVPEVLFTIFEKGISNKKSSSVVRGGYLYCIAAACCGNTLGKAMKVLPQLIKAVERASSQTHQPSVICEGLTAACVLVPLAQAEVQLDSKLNGFWAILLDSKKQVFTSPKFLYTATDEVLDQLHVLLEKLVANHQEKLDHGKTKFWYNFLVFTLTHPNYQVRKNSKSCLTRLCNLAVDSGQMLQSVLLQEFRELVNIQECLHVPFSCASNQVETNGTGVIDHGNRTHIPAKVLKSAIENIVLLPLNHNLTDEKRAKKILLSIIEDVHHPSIASTYPSLWRDLVTRLGQNGEELVRNNKKELFEMIITNTNDKIAPAFVRTLLNVAENILFDDVMEHVINKLRNPAFCVVTDEEFAIFHTPDGVLYDQSKINEIKFGELMKYKNVKKESKAYSYEEQLAEIELKKESMKKNKNDASNEQNMTKKEKEARKAQLEKEREIRTRLEQVDRELHNACWLSKAAVTSGCLSLRKHIASLLSCSVPLFTSPLAAPRVIDVFLALVNTTFPDHLSYLGKRLGYLTLRVHGTPLPLEVDWDEQNVILGVHRMVDDLHNITVPSEDSDSADYSSSCSPLLSTTFSCCFPFLRCILNDKGSKVGGNKEIQFKALQIFSEHCKLRLESDEGDETLSEIGPTNLPRTEMLTLLSDVIQSHSGVIADSKLQHIAGESMVELCKSSSGNPSCTLASDEELDVLLCSLQSDVATLRLVSIQCLNELEMVLPTIDEDEHVHDDVFTAVLRIWTAKFDVDEETAKLADRLWKNMGYFVQSNLCSSLVCDIAHNVEDIQKATSRALAESLSEHPQLVGNVLEQLIELYNAKLKMPEIKKDSLGRIIGDPYQDPWRERRGVARSLSDIGSLFTSNELSPLFSFFVPTGLGDCSEQVRGEMLNAALTAVNQLGKENISSLLSIFETFLDSAPDSSSHDAIRQSVIILMGCLARHLDKEDPKVHPIIVKLLSALSTPSQQVQEAVANCLPPLVPAIKEEAPEIIKNLLTKLLDSTVYGERRGAAYGLAGIVKGLGILSLKQQNIMSTLQDAIQDKKNYRHREGALFAFELLCHMLGRLFEPYIVHVLPHLLLCFGDGNQFVRDATDDTARAMMRNLSAHGVKLVLPSLLKALKEDAWRTKTGSVELLGAMAYCAPKQLSSCLPNIVPRLTEVLTDSHLKVQKAGVQALKHIGSVIRNPEIQAISPVLLEALSDPSAKTTESLHVLINTSFVHVIDAASLALIMPIIHRALEARSTETKKMAAQIIGNMYSLTDQKDLNPYLPSVMPGLKQALLDPVPEVRTVSARALGALVKEVSEEKCDDLLPWLMNVLTSEGSSVDRSGAAQGLSEVLFGLGFDRLSQLMPDVIAATEKSDLAAHVKEGYLMLYLYLPTTFGTAFTPFIGEIIPSILKGLSDESEFVRDTSLKAGQKIVSQYATTAIELFLPQLENGLFDENWRIRISSIQLLGDLLYRVSGVTGKMTTEGDEDDNFGTSHSNQAIIDSLGYDRRNRVLSGLYMGRSDVSLPVRQAALHVWKVVVPNTPRILREILSTLFSLLLGCLASTSHDKRQIAARTLGDLVRKLGERILPEIIPILEKGLKSPKSDERQGVCIGLSEIIDSTSRDQVLVYVDSVVPTVRKALCDPLAEVRESAAQTFNNLYRTIGARVLHDIIPALLQQLTDPTLHENTLDGLRQVMSLRSKEVLPLIIPELIEPPVNSAALASLSTVAGDALTEHLNKILPALLQAIGSATTDDQVTQELEFAQTVILSVQDDIGSRVVLDVLMEHGKDEAVPMRKAAVTLLRSFCTSTKTDIIQHISRLLDNILLRFNDEIVEVLEISWDTLNVVTKRLDPSEQIQQIPNLRKAIKYATYETDKDELPGFCLPKKGITPLLPIFREGILNGVPDVKQDAAEGLGEAIQLTSAAALKPSVVHITGPLIRILGDRFSWNVKVAVLKTLGLLLDKVGVVLKPFLPQLQTTFIKALNDPTKLVRQQASSALQRLIKLHARVDPLFTELHNGIKNTEDNQIRESLLQALRGVLISVGGKMGETIRTNLKTTLLDLQGHVQEIIRVAAAGCVGGLATVVSDEDLQDIVNNNIFITDPTVDWTLRHGRSLTLSALFYDCPERLAKVGIFQPLVDLAITLASADRIPICKTGVKCLGYAVTATRKTSDDIPSTITTALIKALRHTTLDVQVLACDTIWYISKTCSNIEPSFFKPIMPELLALSKDKNTSIKGSSEIAILSIIKLKENESCYQMWLSMLDSAHSSLLIDIYKKAKKLEQRNDTTKCDLDNPFPIDI